MRLPIGPIRKNPQSRALLTSSMHHDLERGNRLEVRWLSGGVVELANEVGIETPLNRAVADILAVHANGRSDH